MYLSEVEDRDYILAVELEDTFLNYLKEIRDKLAETKLDIRSAVIKFDNSKARLIEKGFYPYEDKQVHEIRGSEDPLDYYGFHISKYYFPTPDYWEELKPDEVYLDVTYGNSFGFTFIRDYKKYNGTAVYLSEWERSLS